MQKMGGFSFELAAPLLWGKGVCSGISKAAKFLFDQVGIRSILMTGRTKDRAGVLGEEHCWLMVKIDGQRYHLDLTFDMATKTKRYFNLTDQEILKDRILI
jgi:transglutaminase/protease-like cytokinesis protein 3